MEGGTHTAAIFLFGWREKKKKIERNSRSQSDSLAVSFSFPHPSCTMGCCQSVEDQDGKLRNDEIENQLKRDRANMRNEIKMLLLGTFPFLFLTTHYRHLHPHHSIFNSASEFRSSLFFNM